MSGGGGNSGATTTQETGPPEFQMPFLLEAFNRARELFDQGSGLDFSLNPNQLAANQNQLDFAGGDLGRQIGETNIAQTQALDTTSPNEALATAQQTNTDQIIRQLTEEIVPGIRQGITGIEGTGLNLAGSGNPLATGTAVDNATRAAIESGNLLALEDQQNRRQSRDRALAGAGGVAGLGLLPGEIERNVGNLTQQADTQNALIPFMELAQFMSIIGGSFGGEGTTTSPPTLLDWLGGRLGIDTSGGLI